jgi:hypothetical protein
MWKTSNLSIGSTETSSDLFIPCRFSVRATSQNRAPTVAPRPPPALARDFAAPHVFDMICWMEKANRRGKTRPTPAASRRIEPWLNSLATQQRIFVFAWLHFQARTFQTTYVIPRLSDTVGLICLPSLTLPASLCYCDGLFGDLSLAGKLHQIQF